MTEVHVIYTGIVGFVPTETGFTVVVQKATTGHHAHLPHVAIESAAHKSHAKLTEIPPPAGSPLRAFLLEDYEIGIQNPIEDRALTEDPNFREFVLGVGGGCPSGSAACGCIKNGVLSGTVAVGARIPLTKGELETTFVDPGAQWHFAGFPGAPRFLAEEICHQLTIAEDFLTLRFTKAGLQGSLVVQRPRGART